jgi:hypothetical protein
MSSPLLTVFTPTFNRAHTPGRAYESLVRHTLRDFPFINDAVRIYRQQTGITSSPGMLPRMPMARRLGVVWV